MARAKRQFHCEACGAAPPSWTGSCTSCGQWGTVVEGPAPAARSGSGSGIQPLSESGKELSIPVPTGVECVDEVLGGGLVPGSVTLLGGEPGIGKSTLTLQLASSVADQGGQVVLVAGEESAGQVAGRARRIGSIPAQLMTIEATDVDEVLSVIDSRPQLVIVDSVQTVRCQDLPGVAGSVNQVREAASRMSIAAKRNGVSLLLIGQVTKDGSLAGPRQLEHLVDTVVSLDGDRTSDLRHLRVGKHRFGPAGTVATLEMGQSGLRSVASLSQRLLADRRSDVAGSAVAVGLDGRRPVLVEVQALLAPVAPGRHPQRSVQGFGTTRVDLVIAVLGQRVGLMFDGLDVFVSVPGGERMTDPGLDLGVAVALASAATKRPVAPDTAVFGEVGLTGEVRSVGSIQARLSEGTRSGFRRIIGPPVASPQPGLESMAAVSDVVGALCRRGAPSAN